MDFYSASGMSLLWVCFFQTIAIGWFFGAQRFCDCVEQMTGRKPHIFWYLCWKYFAPIVMIAVFVFYIFSYKPVTYGTDYKYPKWAEYSGLCMSFASMIWVPVYAVYYLLTQPGTIQEVYYKVFCKRVTPDDNVHLPFLTTQRVSRGFFEVNIRNKKREVQFVQSYPRSVHNIICHSPIKTDHKI
jgi:hypothetical protein